MSQEVEKLGFSYVDDTDESLKSKQGGQFGLNTPAYLTKFELNPNAGADGTAGDALDFTIQILDKEYRERVYPVDSVYDASGNEITDKTSAAYVKAYNDAWKQRNACIIHVLKCFRSDAEVRQALSTPVATFADYVNVAVALLPAGYDTTPLDAFLEYQWNISEGQDRTFLQLPRNMKGGPWLSKAVAHVGEWTAVENEQGLKYVDANGAEHPFIRDKNFMSSNKGKQQIAGQEAEQALQSASQGTW